MASQEIDDFSALTSPAAGDLLPIVDVSDTTDSPQGTTKKIAVSDLVTGATVPDDSVTNSKLVNMAQATIKGRASGAGTGDPTDLSGTQATAILDAMVGDSGSGGTKGLAPAPGAGDTAAGKFLKADGTYAVPATGGTGGIGDVVGPSSSIASEIVLFDGTTGKLIKRATTTGLLKATSGVIAAATAGTDYVAPTASINDQTGTTYTLDVSDNGKVLTFNNASAITVTVPSGLGVGFNCMCIQKGAGQVTFSPSSTTVNNRQSHTKIAGQYGVVSLIAYVSNVFVLAGDTAA